MVDISKDRQHQSTTINFGNPISFYIQPIDGNQQSQHPRYQLQNGLPDNSQFMINLTNLTSTPDSQTTRSTKNKRSEKKSLFEGQSFPYRLWYLLSNDFYNDVIKWSSDGNYVIIISEVEFEQKVLMAPRERIFKTSSLKSFVRQLNLYGFHKVQIEKDMNFTHLHKSEKAKWPQAVFANAYFKRSQQELLELVKRRCKVKLEKKKKTFDSEQFSSFQSTDQNWHGNCNYETTSRNIRKNNFLQCPHVIGQHVTTGANHHQAINNGCPDEQQQQQQFLIQFPNVLPQSENSLTSSETLPSVRRNLHETEWSSIAHMQQQQPFNCQSGAVSSQTVKGETKMRGEKETSTTMEKLKGGSTLNPLASFCASLFYPNRDDQPKSCNE